MKTETRIHPNCSEWDEEVDSDFDDVWMYQAFLQEKKKEAIKATQGWDE